MASDLDVSISPSEQDTPRPREQLQSWFERLSFHVAEHAGGEARRRLTHPHRIQRRRLVEAFERRITNRRELEALARAQLSHDAGDEHLPRLGAVRDARGELHCRAEEVVVLGDGLPGVQSDAHAHLRD